MGNRLPQSVEADIALRANRIKDLDAMNTLTTIILAYLAMLAALLVPVVVITVREKKGRTK